MITRGPEDGLRTGFCVLPPAVPADLDDLADLPDLAAADFFAAWAACFAASPGFGESFEPEAFFSDGPAASFASAPPRPPVFSSGGAAFSGGSAAAGMAATDMAAMLAAASAASAMEVRTIRME